MDCKSRPAWLLVALGVLARASEPARQLAQCGGSGSIDASVDFDVKRHVSWSIDAAARNITLTLSFGGAVPGAFLAAALNLRAEAHPMANADVVLVTVGGGGGGVAAGGLLAVHDMWSSAVGRVPRRDDAFGDGRGSLEVMRSSLVGGQAEVVVRRPLGADDARDVAIGAGSSMRLSFAHSSAATAGAAAAAAAGGGGSATGGFVYHGRRAGSYEVDFFSGLVSRQQTSAVRKLKALHGMLMTVTWALFVVAGVFAHRYFPAQKKQHRKIMASAAGGGTVVGVLIAQLFTTSTLGSDHAVRGFSLLCCAIAQGAVGSYIWRYDGIVDRHAAKAKMVAAAAADGDTEGRRPKKAGCLGAALIKLDTAMYGVAQGDGVARTANVRAAHPFLGCALFLAAQWQIASGLKAFGAEPWMSKALYAWWACVAALTFQLERRKGEAAARASNAREPEEQQQEEVEDNEEEEEEEDPIVRPAGNVSLHHARRFVV
jgi:hypothetical protein